MILDNFLTTYRRKHLKNLDFVDQLTLLQISLRLPSLTFGYEIKVGCQQRQCQ